ncbi:MAG: HDIG domain-containing protein [Prevotella sp.]|nr:HDIG domain-containing protein [Prevotella sp.]
MHIKSLFTKAATLRVLLLFVASAICVALLPHADHQSYSYELNQPWRYPLLTAEFDMPILRDSLSAKRLHDSIDANFIPFVRNNSLASAEVVARFHRSTADTLPPQEQARIEKLIREVYTFGVLSQDVYEGVARRQSHSIRLIEDSVESEENVVRSIDASGMLSPAKAFDYIDSAYNAAMADMPNATLRSMSPEVAKKLSQCIVPNVVVDSIADAKFRSQEYLDVNGAMGVIKKGQRIVDRGEIVNPQIFTNLNTYLEMLNRANGSEITHTYYYIGQSLFIIICFISFYIYMFIYRRELYRSMRYMTFTVALITLIVAFAILMFEYINNGIWLVPFAAVAVIVTVFADARTAVASLITAVLIAALVATYPLQFISMEMLAGLFATYSIRQLSRRSQLLRTAGVTFISYSVCYIANILLTYGNVEEFSWSMIGYFAVNSVILSFAYVLIFIVEKIFGFTSQVTLVELSDINNKLLRRLAQDAPGTFQHSMQVSTLASEAARAIGANTQLVRTGALYHDIGKLESPIFFTENQHGVNPHLGLDPETSAQKIISHVTAGLQLASKNKLPAVIKDFITQHHGRGITKYFYNTAVNESNGREVDKSKFQYPGPNPQSRETAILMMADSVEAASRSLKDYSQQSINELVDRIIDGQERDGLFKESPISFSDVEKVKETFKKRLATIYHSRIAYPEIKKEK